MALSYALLQKLVSVLGEPLGKITQTMKGIGLGSSGLPLLFSVSHHVESSEERSRFLDLKNLDRNLMKLGQ